MEHHSLYENQSSPEGLHPMEGTHTRAVHEELQPVGRFHVGEVWKDCLLLEEPQAEEEFE